MKYNTLLYTIILTLAFSIIAFADESICYGTTKDGRLEHGVTLPSKGNNYVSYGKIPKIIGRTYVHSKVRDAIVDAYKVLESELPDKVFKYAETGLKKGGEFKPHKTHRNGLSVDFMVPVVDSSDKSVHLPTHAFNKYGYSIEFDDKGNYKDYKIDYEAMGAHIFFLHMAAKKNGIDIWRVIFDPVLQPYLYQTSYGEYIKQNIEIPKKRSWVRHDDHYHVDFDVACRPI